MILFCTNLLLLFQTQLDINQTDQIFIYSKMQTGIDGKGTKYSSIDEMWEVQLKNKKANFKVVEPVGSQQAWYSKANQYWSGVDASDDGVLGGYGNLSKKDTNFSLGFFMNLVKQNPNIKRQSVIDCGAGIGRISKSLLCQLYKNVDVIDQCQKFINKAKEILKDKNIRHFYVKGLQQFEFQQKYDCIWIQWVLSQLTDEAAVDFLKKSKKSLNENGIIIIKQNHANKGFVVDKDDYSVTRSIELYKELFLKAGLEIIDEKTQGDWPQDLFAVRMYALK